MHQGKFDTVTIAAGADLSAAQYKAVSVAGTIAANSTAVGLLQTKPAATGRHATVGYAGQMKAYAAAAISAGAKLSVTTSGYIITTSGSDVVIGQALAAASSGDLFPGLYNFTR